MKMKWNKNHAWEGGEPTSGDTKENLPAKGNGGNDSSGGQGPGGPQNSGLCGRPGSGSGGTDKRQHRGRCRVRDSDALTPNHGATEPSCSHDQLAVCVIIIVVVINKENTALPGPGGLGPAHRGPCKVLAW